MKLLRIGCLASHNGTNVQAVIDACSSQRLSAEVVVVISNNSGSQVLRRASRAKVPSVHLSSSTHPKADDLDNAIQRTLEKHGAELIVLAGYMKPIGPKVLAAYKPRIVNIHPSLLPKYGGKSMFGHRVHEAVLDSGEKITGATVHLVDSEYDRGRIITQSKVEVLQNDSVGSLSTRVLNREHSLLVDTIERIISGKTDLQSIADGKQAKIYI